MAADSLWLATDLDGREIAYSRTNFQRHLQRHPEIREYVEEARQTVEGPDLVIEEDNGAYSFYKMGLGRGKFAGCYLRVIVRYSSGEGSEIEGRVATFYLTTKVAEGRQVWPRSE